MYRVTDKGKAAILAFLHRSHINGPDHAWSDEEMEAWCEEAEVSGGTIELRSFECWQRYPITLTLAGDQIDEVDEVGEADCGNAPQSDYRPSCYECYERVDWLSPDGRCGHCTRLTPEEVIGDD